MNARELIEDIRGGVPGKCDFCENETPDHQLHPEEAGDWACIFCILRWEANDMIADNKTMDTEQLNKLATDETVESFTYDDCIEPASTGNPALLRAALARLIGEPSGALAGDTSGSEFAGIQSISDAMNR